MNVLEGMTCLPNEIILIIKDFLDESRKENMDNFSRTILPIFNKPRETILLKSHSNSNNYISIYNNFEWCDRLPALIDINDVNE